ncbi:hypothetical protein RDABS01_016637, partial [Bienertia sinuspersici]
LGRERGPCHASAFGSREIEQKAEDNYLEAENRNCHKLMLNSIHDGQQINQAIRHFKALTQSLFLNKCAACYRQFNKLEHLVDHMRTSFHSVHEPICGVCKKHCISFESLREHLIGPLPKVECAKIFSTRGCNICLNIFDSPNTLRMHRGTCQLSRPNVFDQNQTLYTHTYIHTYI